ncbi:MAG TPA: DUF4192 domain-containing protein [Humibacillus xanthopallidus]|nr:DUF4192 domain-containing protein [Humibacillus xanthopallidus]
MPKISLSGPADLLTVLPFHLGFQPTRSVVVVCFHGKRIGLVARFDLPPDHLAGASAAAGLPTLVRDRPSSVCLVGFEEEAGESDLLSAALQAGLEQERVVVQDRLVVRDGRWFTVDCDCCPAGGRPMPEPADVPGVADYVALGHTVLDDRDSLARLMQPLPVEDPRHADLEAAIDVWQARYTVAAAIDRMRAGRLLVDSEELDRLLELEELADDLAELADDVGDLDDDGDEEDDDDEDDDVAFGRFGGFGDVGELAGDGAVVIDLESGRRRRAVEELGRDDAQHTVVDDDIVDAGDMVDDGGEACILSASVLLQAESLAAWSEVLRGEVSGEALAERAPALVGPLRDLDFRDALIAWLCPGSVPLGAFPPALVELLEAFVGADVRAAAAAESVPPQPRPRRGRRKRGRRLGARLGRRAETRVEGRIDGHGASWEDWRAWEEASAPHHVQARLESVCRVVPAAHAAPLLAVVGNYAWWRGDGARAGVAIDAALDLEPDHRLAGLLRTALDHGLRGRGADPSPADDLAAQGPSGSWNSPSSA